MSKQKIRIVLLLVIGLLILVGVFATVQAASNAVGIARGRAQVTAGLLLDTSHPRDVASPLSLYNADGDEAGHHCHEEEAGINPSDY